MTMVYDFAGTRLQQGCLTPVQWHLTLNLVAHERKNKTIDEIEYDASIAYQKLYFWLETNLPNVLVVDVTDEDDLYIANLSANITMYCPGNPSDDLLIQLLHSKLSALAKPDLVVGQLQLKASDTSLQYTFDCSPDEYVLPVVAIDYFPNGTLRDVTPWWMRNDGFCFEFSRPDDATETAEELFSHIEDPMSEFYKLVSAGQDAHIGLVTEPAKIVQVEKWKPKTV
jgi:hypothetical protein